jgi:hypothetical protein
MKEVRHGTLLELQAARPATPAVAYEHQYPFAVEHEVLLWLGPEALPGTQPFAIALRHAGQALPAARFGPAGEGELDLRVSPLGRAEIAALPLGVDRAHEVEIGGW